MYVIQRVAGSAGGILTYGHPGYCNLWYIDAGIMKGPIATIGDDRIAERIRDLLNRNGMESVDMSSIELPPPVSVGADDEED